MTTAQKEKESLRMRKYYQSHKAERNAYAKQYYQDHKAEMAAKEKSYRSKNLTKITARKRARRQNDPVQKQKARNRRLIHKFGIGLEEYNKLLSSQSGCCAICGVPQDNLTQALSVDHDHETGAIRGLLCSNCNIGLGLMRDNIGILMHAAEYLKKYINPLSNGAGEQKHE